MAYEQLILSFDKERQAEKEAEAEQRQTPNVVSTPANDALFHAKPSPDRPGEKIEGAIDIAYTHVRFNTAEDYKEVKRSMFDPRRLGSEAIYENKHDGSKISLKKDKIVIDNTPQNISAALDIAQDKGWEVIKISGGSKESKSELWYQAQMRGLETTGYKPSEQDKKRLLGAQERERKELQSEGLDIKPKSEEQVADKPSEQQEAKAADKPSEQQEAKAADKPLEQQEAKANSKNEKLADQDNGLSQDERFRLARNEIMAEVQKVMPLDEQEYKDIQDSIDKQLATVARTGGKLNLKQTKEDIRAGLPLVRKELDQAAKAEQFKANQEKSKEKQNTTVKNKPVQRTKAAETDRAR